VAEISLTSANQPEAPLPYHWSKLLAQESHAWTANR
jgi:hypothetical protein